MLGLTRDAREMNIILCGPIIPWTGIGKQFWRGVKMGLGLLGLLANS